MRQITAIFASFLIMIAGIPASMADVVSSDEVMVSEQQQYDQQQLLSFVDSDAVQAKLVSLGVDSADAKNRIANMTSAEIAALNSQMQDMPAAGGVAGTVLTVLIVITVLDLLGVTDVFSFIDPIT